MRKRPFWYGFLLTTCVLLALCCLCMATSFVSTSGEFRVTPTAVKR